MEALYDTELMLGGGHVKGWRLTEGQMGRTAEALNALKTPAAMADKYGMAGRGPAAVRRGRRQSFSGHRQSLL